LESDRDSYAPYKYELERFTALNTATKEQVDPTVYTVLMARSKIPGVSLSEFAVFLPKWLNSTDTFRPPVSIRLDCATPLIKQGLTSCSTTIGIWPPRLGD
jgi:homogentisate 1,2-dioxygenase